MIAQQIIKNVKQKLSPNKEPKLRVLDGETKVATEAVIRIFEFLRFAMPDKVKEEIKEEAESLMEVYGWDWGLIKPLKTTMIEQHLHACINVLLGRWILGDVYSHSILFETFENIRDGLLCLAEVADHNIIMQECPYWFEEYNKYFLDKQDVETNVEIHDNLTQDILVEAVSKIPACNQGAFMGIKHNGLMYRSKTETYISNALDSEGCLYFPNNRCRVQNEIRESDFLICHKGMWGILEVDGKDWHTSAAADHARDDLFNAHGVWFIKRYPASECWSNPNKVVNHFLTRLEEFYSTR